MIKKLRRKIGLVPTECNLEPAANDVGSFRHNPLIFFSVLMGI